MTESYDTIVLDAASLEEKMKSGLSERDIILTGEFVEPVEYRHIRSPSGTNLICVDSQVGFESTVFEDIPTAMAEANYQLLQLMSFDRSVISDDALKIVDDDKSTSE